jgi:hypothetical protein
LRSRELTPVQRMALRVSGARVALRRTAIESLPVEELRAPVPILLFSAALIGGSTVSDAVGVRRTGVGVTITCLAVTVQVDYVCHGAHDGNTGTVQQPSRTERKIHQDAGGRMRSGRRAEGSPTAHARNPLGVGRSRLGQRGSRTETGFVSL